MDRQVEPIFQKTDWLVGDGQMLAMIRSMDWRQTPLGPRADWPPALRIAVSVCLNSRFPMFVWWGPQLINVYNDGYIPMLGKRHPDALGRPARESWNDIWDIVGEQAKAVMERGESTWNERVLLVMERHGYTEETYFTWSYSPIYDEHGKVAGLFCAVTEETERVRMEAALRESERRFRAFVTASSDVVYRMSADWSQMHQLQGRQFIVDTGGADGSWLQKYIHPDDQPRVLAAIKDAISAKSVFQLEHRVRRIDGSLGWTFSRAVPLQDEEGQIIEWLGTATDVSERKRAEQLLAAQNGALELVATGASLQEILGALTKVVEEQSDGAAVASILLLDEYKGTLHTGAAPSLPREYNAAVDGIKAAHGIGTCADAAARNEIVCTPDIAAAPSWKGLSHLPLALGLQAAWSMPIRAADGRVVGTFGTYFRECRDPTGRERQVVEGLCRVAAVAIERKNA